MRLPAILEHIAKLVPGEGSETIIACSCGIVPHSKDNSGQEAHRKKGRTTARSLLASNKVLRRKQILAGNVFGSSAFGSAGKLNAVGVRPYGGCGIAGNDNTSTVNSRLSNYARLHESHNLACALCCEHVVHRKRRMLVRVVSGMYQPCNDSQ